MLDPISIVLVLLVLATIGVVVWQRRRPALPPAVTPGILPESTSAPQTSGGTKAPSAAPEHQRYLDGLAKTRGGFVARLSRLFRGRPKVDQALRDEIEEVLFTADIGSATAQKLLDSVTEALAQEDVADPEKVWGAIRTAMEGILDIETTPPNFEPRHKPYVLLMIGVNGVGKTTTLGKLAAMHQQAGRKVLLVAGDTFRAAAVDQLEVWASRVGCDIHRGADRADPSSVIFEGVRRGARDGYDVVLCDTAGRLHTRKELMDELGKVGRAAAKALAQLHPDVPAETLSAHDTYLVLDATIGQNALAQAKLFKETMNFTGLVVTKLDGTAKGGVVLGICDEMHIPVRFIGIGEKLDDLRPFHPQDFVAALLTQNAT